MVSKIFGILLLLTTSVQVIGQDTLSILKDKEKHLYQSEFYYLIDLDDNPLDSSYYIIGGVYNNLKYALKSNKHFRLIYPESTVVFNDKNKKYYIIVDWNTDENYIIKSLYRLRSLFEPLAWILVYY
jgi:hypothetical protein